MLKRILIGIIGIPIFIILIIMGGWYLFALILILSNLSIWEYLKIANLKQAFPIKSLSYILNTAFITVLFLSLYIYGDYSGGHFTAYLIILILLNTILHTSLNLWNKAQNNTMNIAAGIAVFNYITLFFSCILAIAFFKQFAENFLNFDKFTLIELGRINWNYIVLSLFIAIWANDTFAYFIGRAVGKHKLFPRISPKKSWEGAVAGLFGAVFGFALPLYYLLPAFSLTLSIIIGTATGIIGPIGDLAESQLKRDAGIKDSSNLIPGHGGVLDRFDSMLFTAPVALVIIILYYTLQN